MTGSTGTTRAASSCSRTATRRGVHPDGSVPAPRIMTSATTVLRTANRCRPACTSKRCEAISGHEEGGMRTGRTLPRPSLLRHPARFGLAALGIALGLGGLLFGLCYHGLSAEEWASRPSEELEALARRNPRLPGAQLGLGVQYARAGDTPRAVTALERCIALAPDTMEAYAALGEIARRQGNDRRAAAMFARAVSLDPRFDEGCLQAANAFTRMQSYRRARPYAATYSRRRP